MLRAKINGVKVIRDNFSERFKSDTFYELDVQSKMDFIKKMGKLNARVNEFTFYNAVFNSNSTIEDGLSTTKYQLKSKEKFEKYTLLKCKLENENENFDKTKLLQSFDDYTKSLND